MAEIRLVGTAHVSQKSVEEVRSAIEEFQPDIVGVELDRGRFISLTEETAEPSVTEILKSGNFGQILLQWILTYIQQRIGAETGVKPGSEMLAAIEEARAHQKPVAFIDRDIRITLSRFWGLMGIREKIRLIWALLYSLVSVDTQEIEIDELTDQDVVSVAMEEFRKFSPRGAQALIDERDAYLAHQILMLARRYDRVLAVIGAGHIKGVQRYLDAPETLPLLSDLTAEVKKGLPWAKILGAGVTILFLLLIAAIADERLGIDEFLFVAVGEADLESAVRDDVGDDVGMASGLERRRPVEHCFCPCHHGLCPLCVEASPPDAEQDEWMPFRNLNDGVTPVVLGSADYAAAWAVDDYDRP